MAGDQGIWRTVFWYMFLPGNKDHQESPSYVFYTGGYISGTHSVMEQPSHWEVPQTPSLFKQQFNTVLFRNVFD